MPYDELLNWVAYFGKRPVGWRDDNRAYLLMRSFGAKGKPEDYFGSLRAIKIAEEDAKSETAGRVAPSGKFLEMMKKARNGDIDKLPWRK